MALKAEPHERLVKLMRSEYQGKSSQSDVSVTSVYVEYGVNSQSGDDTSTDEISLRREAHSSNLVPT